MRCDVNGKVAVSMAWRPTVWSCCAAQRQLPPLLRWDVRRRQ